MKEVQNNATAQSVYDLMAALANDTIKRLWAIIIVLIVLLFGTNAAWIYYESQYSTVSIEQDVDTGEGDAFVVGNGDFNYGEDKAKSENPCP